MQAVVEGRITGDVVIEKLASGKTVANVRIAENKTYRDDKGERQTKTNFHTVKVWNQVADALSRVAAKGDLVKFRVTVTPHSYLNERKAEVINELKLNANRFKLVRQARANQNN